MDDRLLLQRFVKDNSQEAFAALTARYLNLVYAVCRRELGDADLAEDVTQAVFLILARKAPSLRREVVLSGWLFQTARFAAKNACLTAQRRAAYEQKAAEAVMEQQAQTEDEHWAEIEPLLNQSLAALKAGERDCVLLRFFQGMSFAETGASLGLSEDAARKRVIRALEKMRRFFVKNGVVIPSAALAVLLTSHAAKAAPASLAPAITQLTVGVLAGHMVSAASTGLHAYLISQGAMNAMRVAQIKLALGITSIILIGSSAYAFSRVMSFAGRPGSSFSSVTKPPGHVLQQVPGKTLTASQIAERCRHAYANLTTYQGTSTVNEQAIIGGTAHDYQASASVKFVRPGKISAQGTDTSGDPFGYVSDGVTTEESYPTIVNSGHSWHKVNGDDKTSSTEAAIAGATGIAAWAATTIPELLIGETWGYALPLTTRGALNPNVREDAVDSQSCYVLTAHAAITQPVKKTETGLLWIDEKTFLVRRYVSESDGVTQAVVLAGRSLPSTTIQSHSDQRFTDERVNQPIPESAFALPTVQ